MPTHRILIAGSGFAGVWAALSAARALALAGREQGIEIALVSPRAELAIRPRFYEAALDTMTPDVSKLLDAVGARHIAGIVDTIDVDAKQAHLSLNDGSKQTIRYDRFVLATGSRLAMPPIPGLAEHGFNVDTIEAARTLDAHLKALSSQPSGDARGTVVVAGGGFTGLETASEMPDRLRDILGNNAATRVVIVDPADQIGGDMGAEAAVVVRDALDEMGIEQRPGLRVSAVDAYGVTLSNGEHIAANTVVWTAGVKAHPLATAIPGAHDASGRVIGDAFLRAPEADGVFVTGDTVKAATDDAGNHALMTCQHALSLGRVAGHNAAAELVGLPLHPYSQPKYVTCLDLGSWGALYTEGWDRQVRFTRQEGKAIKREINGVWIYPPAADRDAVFAVANPDFVIVP